MIRNRFPINEMGTGGVLGSSAILKYTFGILLFTTILLLILYTIHYTVYPIFSFRAGDGGIVPIPALSDTQIAYKDIVASARSPTAFTDMQSCYYTLSMDVYLNGSYDSKPRLLLYRNTGQIMNLGSITKETLTINSATNYTTITSIFPNTNILLWFDPSLNDMYATVLCHSGSSGSVHTSKPITNLPIRKVFRVSFLFTQKFVEIYINGKLRQTLLLSIAPRTTENVESNFYTSMSSTLKVSNVYYWNTILNPREIEAYGTPIATESLFV